MTSLDSQRKLAKAAGWLLLTPPLFLLLSVTGLLPWHLSGGWLFVVVFGMMVVAAVTVAVLGERYKAGYKKEVVAPLIKQVDPAAAYEPDAKLDPAVLDATGLFPRAPDSHSENRVRGNLNGVPYQFCNVHLWRTVREPNRDTDVRKTLFHGLFLQIALPYTINGLTCLIGDDEEPKPPKAVRQAFKQADLGLGERFDAQYAVWTSSPTDAKAVLTPELAARLAEHGEDSDYPARLSFHDGFVSVAVDCGDVLEASMTGGQRAAQQTAFEIDGIFGLARGLIEILQVQSPRFAPRPVAAFASPTAAAAGSPVMLRRLAGASRSASASPIAVGGTVADDDASDAAAAAATVAASPWDQHGRAKPAGDLRQIAEKVRGAGVGVELEGSSTMTLQYGLRPGLFYALVLGVLWLAIAATIAGVATGTPPEGSPVRVTTALPMLAGAFAWLAQYHPATTAVALIAGLISLSSTFSHVRRAKLTKSSVETVRVLWPMASRQAVDASTAPSVVFAQHGGVFVGSTRVSPPLPFETGAMVAHSIASFFGVDASVPIKEPTVKWSSNLRVGKKNYSSSNR